MCSLSELTSSNAPDDVAAQFADLQMGVFLDGDTTSENVKGNIIGFCMASEGREEIELILLLQKLLMDFDSKGELERQGKAVCLASCKGVDGIWVYGREVMEVQEAGLIMPAVEGGGWLCRTFFIEKDS